MHFKATLSKLTLLVLTVSSVFSCITVNKTIGEEYVPEDQELKIRIAHFRLPVTLKMQDSLQATSADYAIVGAIRTPEFGLVKMGSAANVCQPSTTLRFGKDPVIKSIYFTAAVTAKKVMEENQTNIPQDIFVYRLKKRLDTTTVFCNSVTSADYDPLPLNTSSVTYFGGDSIKVYLNNAYGTELLSATEKELDSINLFIDRFKGLYIECSAPEGSLTGGRENLLGFSSAVIMMKYNFQPTWQEGLSRKDTTVYLSYGDGYCLNTSSYSSEDLETDEPREILPVEGIAGIKPYVDAKVLKDTLDKWAQKNNYDPKKIIVSKASFSLPFEIPANFDMTTYPTYLFPTQRIENKNVKIYYPFNDVNSTGNSLGAINRSLAEYQGDISSVIQQMLNKNAAEIEGKYDFWFAPIQQLTDQYYGTVSYSPDFYSYYVGKINGPKAERYPKLTLVFSVLK